MQRTAAINTYSAPYSPLFITTRGVGESRRQGEGPIYIYIIQCYTLSSSFALFMSRGASPTLIPNSDSVLHQSVCRSVDGLYTVSQKTAPFYYCTNKMVQFFLTHMVVHFTGAIWAISITRRCMPSFVYTSSAKLSAQKPQQEQEEMLSDKLLISVVGETDINTDRSVKRSHTCCVLDVVVNCI